MPASPVRSATGRWSLLQCAQESNVGRAFARSCVERGLIYSPVTAHTVNELKLLFELNRVFGVMDEENAGRIHTILQQFRSMVESGQIRQSVLVASTSTVTFRPVVDSWQISDHSYLVVPVHAWNHAAPLPVGTVRV